MPTVSLRVSACQHPKGYLRQVAHTAGVSQTQSSPPKTRKPCGITSRADKVWEQVWELRTPETQKPRITGLCVYGLAVRVSCSFLRDALSGSPSCGDCRQDRKSTRLNSSHVK